MLTFPHCNGLTCYEISHKASDLRLIFWHEELLDLQSMWRVWRTVDVHTRFCWRDLMERNQLEDLGVDGRVILK